MILNRIVDLILPRECHVCGDKLAREEKFICSPCINELPRTLYHRYWQNSGEDINADINPMEARFAGIIPFRHATAAFFYERDTKLALLVQDFKYRKFPGLAYTLGMIAAKDIVHSGFFTGIDFIMPIPLHWTKKMRRGYNQCDYLAKGVAEITGLPVKHNLRANKSHQTQTHLSREKRQKNLNDVFSLNSPEEIDNKSILLIDDICTTGTTLLAASETITESCPGARLSLLTLGVTY